MNGLILTLQTPLTASVQSVINNRHEPHGGNGLIPAPYTARSLVRRGTRAGSVTNTRDNSTLGLVEQAKDGL